MQITTGIDILDIGRMEKSLQRQGFLQRFFSDCELEQFRAAGERPNFLAGSFCAKEAFSKAVGTGVRHFALREVEVLRDKLGKPHLSFTGDAAALVAQLGYSFDVSISHTDSAAVAVVVAYRP